MLKELLAGANSESQQRLDELFEQIGDEPLIAWYPSAENDYRDIMELCTERARLQKITEEPDLFFHTDYARRNLKSRRIVYKDLQTEVKVENKFYLRFRKRFNYVVNPDYISFPEDALKRPLIWLLDVVVKSETYGIIRKPVIYFVFENINFFDEFILKYRVPITYFIKIREGCGFGGNRKSISIVYAFLSIMKTQYLLVDQEEHTDFTLVDQMMSKHNINPENYCLEMISSGYWSGLNYSAFRVSYEKLINTDSLNSILRTISRKSHRH